MVKFWQKRIQSPTLTENLHLDHELEKIQKEIKNHIHRKFAGSLSIRMVDSGSCNACEAECNALSNPFYDLERLGINFVASPRHADVMLLSGMITFNMYHHVIDAYHQMPQPAYVITLGDCPLMQAPFDKTYALKGNAEKLLPVSYHIPGCPPEPKQIMEGLVGFLRSLGKPA